jgi:hypothetical protein
MTYRNDSDFFLPYEKLEKIGGVDDKNDLSFPAGNGKQNCYNKKVSPPMKVLLEATLPPPKMAFLKKILTLIIAKNDIFL